MLAKEGAIRGSYRTRAVFVALLTIAGLMALHPAIAAPPANDDFESAQGISVPFTASVDVSEAGPQFGETSCWFNEAESYRTVWYRYVATTTSRIAARVTDDVLNTRLGVYTGSSLKSLQTHRCDTGYGEDYPARVAWDPVIGQTYYIKIGAAPGGEIDVDISIPQAPPHDERANAHVVDPVQPLIFEHLSDENAGGDAVGEPRPSCVFIDDRTPTVWYQLSIPADGLADFIYTGVSSFSYSYVALYEQKPDASLTQLDCSYSGSIDRIRPKPNTTYFFQVIDPWEGGSPMGLSIEPPVANDNFDEALEITDIPFAQTVDISMSTLELGEPQPGCMNYARGSVWFKYTSDADEVIEMVPTTDNSNYYTGWIGLFRGSSMADLKEVGCSIAYRNTPVRTEIRQGETVYIQLGLEYATAQSALTLSVRRAESASNDLPHQATDLGTRAVLPSTFSTSTTLARLSKDEPAPTCGSDPGSTSWFSITSPIAQRLSFSSGNYDTILAAYDTDLNEIACNDDVDPTKVTSKLTLDMEAGTKYLLSVSGTKRVRGSLVVTVLSAPPINDDFEAATQIITPRYVHQQKTQGATLQHGEPQPPSSCIGSTNPNTISFTVWYRFTPQEDMSLTASVFGNNLQTLVAVYTGDQLDELTSVACSAPTPDPAPGVTGTRVQAATFPAEAGTTYYFQVGHRATVGQTAVPFQLNRMDGAL